MMRPAGAVLAEVREAAFTPLAELTGGGPILVLTPHPDDESLGCGGLIAACGAAGIAVHVALLTDGAGSHPGSRSHPPARLAAVRLGELRAALGELGVPAQRLVALGWPDSGAPRAGTDFFRARDQVVAMISRVGATAIFSCWGEDPHCDHAAAADIASAAATMTGIRHYAYPVWGWMLPGERLVAAGRGRRLDISQFLEVKRRAVACHRSQCGGVIEDAAEAFVLPAALLDACLTECEYFFEQDAVA